ncbi:MAG: polysaccharide biosynthesis protein [Coriobacteriales bacterium]|nr:polysaccharide biosynthesis protein [Coriobacteriales bacterium]
MFLVVWDFLATYLALTLASFGTQLVSDVFVSSDTWFNFGISAVINIAAMLAFRLYNNLWEYASYREIMRLAAATASAAFIGALIHYMIGFRFPISVYFVAWVLFLFFAGVARFAFRYIYHGRRLRERRPSIAFRPRTLIVGAGETGSLTIKRMTSGDYAMQGLPIVAVDDDPDKIGTRINNVKVEGRIDDILAMVQRLNIQQIVMAIPSATVAEKKRIFDICMQTSCNLLTLPNVRDLRMDELDDVHLREVDLTDLLSREEIVLNTRLVSGYLSGKRVLITGGGGSIGSELARQICLVAPRQLIIFDIYENTAYELALELGEKYDDVDIRVEIGSIRDAARLEALFEQYRPDVVFHAAAHKHVPLMEANPREAIFNNVFGTLNLVQAADAFAVDKFIFISTDKAVNPSSVMGATKRLGELIVQSIAAGSQTCFSAVRFGNVLGSHGSVIPMFKRQIAEGGPVTITHPDISRYFMTIPEASRLVVTAGGLARGGEIFILNMGEPVKIDDLARKLIRLSGLEPEKDIMVKYVGLRPGEKLYEELSMESETTQPTDVADILVSTNEPLGKAEVSQKIENLRECLLRPHQCQDVKACLAAQVPSYVPSELSIALQDAEEAL